MAGEDYICAYCGFRGSPVRVNRGHIYFELFLWLCLIVPGIIYSAWRRIRKQEVCPECLNPEMISIYSQKSPHHDGACQYRLGDKKSRQAQGQTQAPIRVGPQKIQTGKSQTQEKVTASPGFIVLQRCSQVRPAAWG